MRAVFGVKSCNWGGCEGVLVNYASEPPLPILLSLRKLTTSFEVITLSFKFLPFEQRVWTYPLTAEHMLGNAVSAVLFEVNIFFKCL